MSPSGFNIFWYSAKKRVPVSRFLALAICGSGKVIQISEISSVAENRFQYFGVRAEKCRIFQLLFLSRFGTGPHPGSFYIQSDKIFFGIQPGQAYRVFSFPATHFQHDRVVVSEYRFVPFSSKRVFGTKNLFVSRLGKRFPTSPFQRIWLICFFPCILI